MSNQLIFWLAFGTFLMVMLALDLGFFHRRHHVVQLKEALVWSAVWITLAMLFNLAVYLWHGHKSALEFLTGYLIELSLSVDNLFVFLVIFSYFRVPSRYQHKVLFWGILGAIILRGIFITGGVVLVQKLEWIIYVFGTFLVITGIRMAFQREKEIHPERNPIIKLFRKFVPVTKDYEEGKFFVKRDSGYLATPLFIVLLVVETTDIVFAVDSVPAILAITLDPFIVFTSNVFAILGLRSFFFALAGIMGIFHYLRYGLSAILIFVGIKMLLAHYYKIPTGVALGVVSGILLFSVMASLIRPHKKDVMPTAEDSQADGNGASSVPEGKEKQ